MSEIRNALDNAGIPIQQAFARQAEQIDKLERDVEQLTRDVERLFQHRKIDQLNARTEPEARRPHAGPGSDPTHNPDSHDLVKIWAILEAAKAWKDVYRTTIAGTVRGENPHGQKPDSHGFTQRAILARAVEEAERAGLL